MYGRVIFPGTTFPSAYLITFHQRTRTGRGIPAAHEREVHYQNIWSACPCPDSGTA